MPQVFPPYSVKVITFGSGERCPAVVDAAGMLAFDPNVYGMVVLRPREQSSNTMETHLRAVVLLLNWAAGQGIDLSARMQSLEMLSPTEMASLREALHASYRKPAVVRKRSSRLWKARVAPVTLHSRCAMARDYVAWFARGAIQRIKTDDPKLRDAADRLSWFEREMVNNLPQVRTIDKEGLSAEAQALFLEVIHPDCPRNPFQPQHRHRNYALLLLYFETGIRRSEALKIKGEHLLLNGEHPKIRIVRDPDDPKDPRRVEPKVKTLPHDDEISLELAKALRTWVVEHRSDPARYPGAKRTPYCFVSRRGTPLGVRTVNDMFDLLSSKFEALGNDVYAHILRHTANDRFSDAARSLGLTDAEETSARNYKFGWSKTSKQGQRYSSRSIRQGADRVVQRMQEASVKGKNR